MKILNELLVDLAVGLIAVLGYIGILCGVQTISHSTSPKITSQSRLEKVVKMERKKLNIPPEIQIGAIFRKDVACGAIKIEDEHYRIGINWLCNSESAVRHEIYHIADGHLGGNLSLFKYLFWAESQATIYEVTGLKP